MTGFLSLNVSPLLSTLVVLAELALTVSIIY